MFGFSFFYLKQACSKGGGRYQGGGGDRPIYRNYKKAMEAKTPQHKSRDKCNIGILKVALIFSME